MCWINTNNLAIKTTACKSTVEREHGRKQEDISEKRIPDQSKATKFKAICREECGHDLTAFHIENSITSKSISRKLDDVSNK